MQCDTEDFLSEIKRPIETIIYLSELITANIDGEWDLYTSQNKEEMEKLLGVVFAIGNCAQYISSERKKFVNNLVNLK